MRCADSLHHLDPEYPSRARKVPFVLPDAADEPAIDPLAEHREEERRRGRVVALLSRVLRSALLLARDGEIRDAGLSQGPDHSGGPSVT